MKINPGNYRSSLSGIPRIDVAVQKTGYVATCISEDLNDTAHPQSLSIPRMQTRARLQIATETDDWLGFL